MWAVILQDSDGELWRVLVASEVEGRGFVVDAMLGCAWPCAWVVPVSVSMPGCAGGVGVAARAVVGVC